MMAPPDFDKQYISVENLMKSKFATDFPEHDVAIFNTCFVNQRIRSDAGGARERYSYEQRRWFAEMNTWKSYWPTEDFPGEKPPSAHEIIVSDSMRNSQQAYGQSYNTSYRSGGRGGPGGRGRGRGRGRAREFRGDRANTKTSSRGRHSRAGSRASVRGRGIMPQGYLSTGSNSLSQYERSSFNMRGEGDLINFDDKATSQDPSSLFIADTTDNHLTSVQDQSSSAIVCLQCGAMGHAEVICLYQIAIKQSVDHERHLVCGTLGHKCFRFGSYHGCLACKEEREDIMNKQLSEHTLVPTTKTESKVTFATRADHFVGGGGWEEHGINETIRRGTKRPSGLGINEITSGIEAQTLDKHTKAVIEEYDEKVYVKPEREELLIEF